MAAAVLVFSISLILITTVQMMIFCSRQHGVDILVDDMSLGGLENAQLDYVEELVGSFFRIENPNATASCGCGTSFSV